MRIQQNLDSALASLKNRALILCAFTLFLSLARAPNAVAGNDLSLGKSSKLDGAVHITINPPADFNFKTAAQILGMRQAAINQQAKLLSKPYKPDDDVFGQMEDRKPWWGLEGYKYYGRGQDSIRGQAFHSNFILNPFLLVGIDCNLQPQRSTPPTRPPAMRLYVRPSALTWWPKNRQASVVYEFKELLSSLGTSAPSSSHQIPFRLLAYNARDLGLPYMYVSLERASNVVGTKSAIFLNPQFIHCGGSCGYPGGCNNQSPQCAPLDNFFLVGLPARLEVLLYKHAPETGKELPDIDYFIDMK